MTKLTIAIVAGAIFLSAGVANADTISGKEIAAGVSDSKTELEQESWWDENMGGKLHEITGTVTDVEKGTFSGYWVTLDAGRNIMVRCGMSGQWDGIVQKIKKGQKYACKGYVSGTWTAIFGIAFSVDAG